MIRSLLGSTATRILFVAAALSVNVAVVTAAQATPAACREAAISYCQYLLPDIETYAACVQEQVAIECPGVVPEGPGGLYCARFGDTVICQ